MVAGAVTLGAMSAQAGLLDGVRSKAAAAGTAPAPAARVRDKTEELLQRAAETQSTVNAVIGETDIIKRRLEPVGEAFETVRGMKQRFQDLQFDPAELLDTPELEDAIEQLKQWREAMQERLNDPQLEQFRGEFLDTVGALRGLVAAEIGLGERERSAVETLVENAPRTVMALIKAAAETGFGRLQDDTRQLAADVAILREKGVLRDFVSADRLCRAHRFESEAIYFMALRARKRIVAVTTRLKILADRIPATPMRFGVHGYAQLVQIDMGSSARDKIGTIVIALEGLGARVDLIRETASHYSTPGRCGA